MKTMTYEEANEKLIEVVRQIQTESSIEVLNSVMQTTAFQVACLYDWMLKNRFHNEQVELATKAQQEQAQAVTEVEATPVQ